LGTLTRCTVRTEGAETSEREIYYDPFDFEVDKDPHPVWRRMREEAPLYRNEKFGFFALSRFADVERGLVDWDTYRSGRGSTLELLLAGVELPPGIILFEDPPIHDVHRGLMSRVFTPRKMNALEPTVRAFCAQVLDELQGGGGFDFVRHLGAYMPMRTIGMLLGIPERDQEAIRERMDEGMRLEDGSEVPVNDIALGAGTELFAEYIDWRAEHPSDDLMTDLLTAEFEDETGTIRTLTRTEVLQYIILLAGAGNETTTRLIGWTGKLLAEHPDQRRELARDRSLLPQAIEEILRYEAPSPVQARYVARDVEHYGQKVPEGSFMLLLNGSANRDDRHFPDGDRFDIHRTIGHHLSFGYGIHFCLGAALARLEGRIALDEVLNRWTDWEVDWANAKQAHTPTVRGWDRLPVLTS
jgi:cytochrome P450